MRKDTSLGYLPNETPPIGKLLLYALQNVIVMAPATILVALITGFHISTTLFGSGLATICFILITKRKIPLYYGSSFAYISAIVGVMAAEAAKGSSLDTQIGVAQFGIVASGLVSIVAGIIVRFVGIGVIKKYLPPAVTGPIAMVIGLTLAGTALQDATAAPFVGGESWAWVIALSTLLATVLYSTYLKGFLKQISFILGPLTGVAVACLVMLVTGENVFRALPEASTSFFSFPKFTMPIPNWASVIAIMPIAIATIPESTAHLYQLDIYVNNLAKERGEKHHPIADKLWINLIGDGMGDMISAVVGGSPNTNYGENISTMAITKVFSSAALLLAGAMAVLISFITPFTNALYSIPLNVIGGLEIYLFGAIAAQGIAILMDEKVSMFSAKNIAVIAIIIILGVGGQYAFGGSIPFFGIKVPCVAAASIAGILLNWALSFRSSEQPE